MIQGSYKVYELHCIYNFTLQIGKWYAPGELIFNDEFDTLNPENWEHEITLAGGGNWEFQAYTHNRSNRRE